RLAFMSFDDKPVNKFTITPTYPTRGNPELIAYPKSGDPNPLVRIGVAGVGLSEAIYLNMGEHKLADIVYSRVGWLPGKKSVFAYVQNRQQTWLDFTVWESPTAAPKVLFRDQTAAWVEDLGQPHWLADGSFLIESERTGYKHLYHYKADGTLIRPVTHGEWEVRTILKVDEEKKRIHFMGTKDGSTKLNLYRVNFDGSDFLTRTDGVNSHTVSLAPDGELFIDRATNNLLPTQVSVHDGSGKRLRMLDQNPVHERDDYAMCSIERVSIATKKGYSLEGVLIKPANFDATKKYPIWFQTYAGPHFPTVRDGWNLGRGREQMLANMGLVIFQVDPHSASGKGAASAWQAYKQLGIPELEDLEMAVDWFGQFPWADLSRVGLSGHSYGGFMTSFALTHSKKFAAGIAGAPVTDWHLYDSIYTERFMDLPKNNKDGYEKTSVVKAAKNLHGRLLLIHGLVDDNVHFQNTSQLVDALQQAGKDFEVMFYPRARHGIGGRHYQQLQLDFIRRTMKLPPPTTTK
ncbi:MAG: prolyl oligopeptidase family serine peptidase, partial [Gemmataceae bacterium]